VRVLIVDDEPYVRDAVRDLLEQRGRVVVSEAADGKQAMAAVAGFAPELVLLDLHLGGESGLDVASALTTEWPDLPVLLLTVGSESQERIRKSGARGLIVKHRLHTVDLDALLRELSTGAGQPIGGA